MFETMALFLPPILVFNALLDILQIQGKQNVSQHVEMVSELEMRNVTMLVPHPVMDVVLLVLLKIIMSAQEDQLQLKIIE